MSLEANGPTFWNKSMELNKLKKLLFDMCKYLVVKNEPKCVFFIDFLVQASICAFGATKLKLKPWGQSHVVYLYRKFQLRIFSILEKKSGQRDTLKLRKIAIPQNRKWHHKKKYTKFKWISISPENFMKIGRNLLYKNRKKIIKISIVKGKKNQ